MKDGDCGQGDGEGLKNQDSVPCCTTVSLCGLGQVLLFASVSLSVQWTPSLSYRGVLKMGTLLSG